MTTLTTPGLAESIRKRWGITVLVYVDHPAGAAYAWAGSGTLTYDGHDWIGIGPFGSLTGIGDSKRLAVRTLTLGLAGIPADALHWLNAEIRNRSAKAWLAGLTRDGRINGAPWPLMDGRCDYQELKPENNGRWKVLLTITEPVWSIERASSGAFTPQWLKSLHGPDVGGCDDIPGMRNKVVNWRLTA